MFNLAALSDIAKTYAVTLGGVYRWCEADTFPSPIATYGASKRPLFDPAEVEAWVRANRPQYAQEVSA
tara:strand:+ start:1970 stop:2173 length:204 start_codon:yes stop_codon:yes gene_type:complete